MDDGCSFTGLGVGVDGTTVEVDGTTSGLAEGVDETAADVDCTFSGLGGTSETGVGFASAGESTLDAASGILSFVSDLFGGWMVFIYIQVKPQRAIYKCIDNQYIHEKTRNTNYYDLLAHRM